MGNDYFKRVAQKTATRFWINNVTPEQARLAIEAGAICCTQNPSYTWKMLNDGPTSKRASFILDGLMKEEADDEVVLRRLQLELIGEIATIFEPVYTKSMGRQGWVTIQGSPLYEDEKTILDYARLCRQKGPNVMVKIPATKAGIAAMAAVAKEGCPVLATEVMSVAQAIEVCELFEAVYQSMANPPAMLFAHIPGIFDEHLQNLVAEQNITVDPDALWQAGITVAKKIRRMMDDRGYHAGMLSGGARGLHHFTEMVGADSGVTINWDGAADALIAADGVVVDRFNTPPAPDVVDELCEKLPVFSKAWQRGGLTSDEYEDFGPVVLFRQNFEKAWRQCLGFIAQRR